MKEKKNKYIKTNIIGFVIAMVIVSGFAVYAAVTFPSKDVTYENGTSGLESNNVQGAIDEIYNICTALPPATDTITDLLPSNPDELYEDEHGDIRYYGKSPNNYVSFNNELWRIIGVIDGKIKIIRNKSIGRYAWASSRSSNWNNASLKSYLNGEYYNSINETYKKMISEETYYLGGSTNSNQTTLTAGGYYNAERDSSQVYSSNPASTTQYIGLMYPSDYGYAAGSSCLSTSLFTYNSSCKNSDYLFSRVGEWLQAPFASGSYHAAYLSNVGHVNGSNSVVSSYAVRPVLYLNTNVQITGGDGSQGNEFQLG